MTDLAGLVTHARNTVVEQGKSLIAKLESRIAGLKDSLEAIDSALALPPCCADHTKEPILKKRAQVVHMIHELESDLRNIEPVEPPPAPHTPEPDAFGERAARFVDDVWATMVQAIRVRRDGDNLTPAEYSAGLDYILDALTEIVTQARNDARDAFFARIDKEPGDGR